QARTDRGASDTTPCAGDLSLARVRRGRGSAELRRQSYALISRGRRLRRQDFERNQAGRLTGDAADEIRTGYQPQDRKGVWPRNSADAARPRRRGDRMMRRREFIALLSGAAAAWPLAAHAQQGERMRRIGVLMNLGSDDAEGQARNAAFLQGLQELGWTVG